MKYTIVSLLFLIVFTVYTPTADAGVKSVNYGGPVGQVFGLPLGGNLRSTVRISLIYAGYVQDQNRVLNDFDAVPVGSTVHFRNSVNNNTDVFWFFVAGQGASPFAPWNVQSGGDFFNGCTRDNPCITPRYPAVSITHAGTAGLNCWNNGFDCTVTSPGTIVSTINFAVTHITFTSLDIVDSMNLGIPAQAITFWLNAFQPNRAPNVPVIAGNGGNVNQVLNFNFSATDPDNDTVAILVDWNNDGVGDAWAPPFWSPSGGNKVLQKSWNSGGAKTFQARTMDSNGTWSGWTSHQVVINNPVLPPTVITGGNAPTPNSALVSGTVNPNGGQTSSLFRYGVVNTGNCATLPNATAVTNVGSGWNNVAYNTQINGLNQNTTYYYCATASNNQGVGSGVISSFTTPIPVPNTPSNLTAIPNGNCGSGAIDISWDNTPNATGYTLLVDGVAINLVNTTYPHVNLAPTSAHTYQVRANGVSGNSLYSGIVNAVASAFCPAPDLISQNLTVPALAKAGGPIGLNAEVKNVSATLGVNSLFDDDFTYRWNNVGGWNNFVGNRVQHPGLLPNAVGIDNKILGLGGNQTGNLFIQHCVDSDNLIDERPNEANCAVANPIRVIDGSLSASAINVDYNDTVTFSWSTQNSAGLNCSVVGGNDTWNWNNQLNPPGRLSSPLTNASYNYVLGCRDNANNSITLDNVVITVNVDPKLTATPKTVKNGGDLATLTWDVHGQQLGCTLTGGNGMDAGGVALNAYAPGATASVKVLGRTTYKLDCPVGQDATVTIDVAPKVYET